MTKKYIWICPLVGMCIFVVVILSRIFGDVTKSGPSSEVSQQKYFAILPHFTIQPKTIEKFYQFLQTTYKLQKNDTINIVIISPDHFNASTNAVDMLCENSKKFCFKNICLPAQALPATKFSGCLPTKTTTEHGLGNQFSFIQKYFPRAKIFPIVVKPRTFVDDTEIIHMLSSHHFVGKTVVLASVDFSHYTDEDFAKLHDTKSFYTLNNATNIHEYSSLEVDCPSCLYIANTLAQQDKQYPRLFLRDSSSTIVGKNLGIGNTSREFIYYTWQKKENNGFTLAFFGDLMFDRQVATALSGAQEIKKQFETFFQKEDITLSPSTYPHRKLFGIDFVGFNLETPVVGDKTICQKSGKEVSFCSSSNILPYLSSIWFTMVNIANNHSFDWGILAHQESIKEVQANNILPIWYIRSSTYFEKNYEYKTTIRSIKIAREGFDFTITPRNLFDTYCSILQKNKTDGFINVVSVHRGLEYQTTHSVSQESLGKQLIDCWADIIIGHHPHVVQDIWRYQGKPIIYSLWNFLFDMHTPETERGEYVLIDYNTTNKYFSVTTGAINASVQ